MAQIDTYPFAGIVETTDQILVLQGENLRLTTLTSMINPEPGEEPTGLEALYTEMDTLQASFAALDSRLDSVDTANASVDQQLSSGNALIAASNAHVTTLSGLLDSKVPVATIAEVAAPASPTAMHAFAGPGDSHLLTGDWDNTLKPDIDANISSINSSLQALVAKVNQIIQSLA